VSAAARLVGEAPVIGPDKVATDLHGHTLFSDGRATPEDFVHFRAELGFDVVAISDHDTFAGVPRAAAAAQALGVTLVPAMEVTTFVHFGTPRAEQIHLLAYFPPGRALDGSLGETRLGARAVAVCRRWRQFVLAWLDGLPEARRWFLDPERTLEARVGTEFPQLQSFLNLLHARDLGVYEDFIRHHVRFWTEDAELFGWSPEQAIETIRADGAIDVVAHPNRIRDKARMDRVLDAATGIEVYTSRHAPEIAARFLARAEATGKLWTASADDHGHTTYVRPADGTPRASVDRLLAGR
jgi:histidinol phosphatase-like PHP family hydrolase